MSRRLSLVALATAAAAVTAPAQAAPPLRMHSYGGTLEIRHTDDFKHDRSKTMYALVRGGRHIPLRLTRAPRIKSGAAVVLTGRRVGSRLKGSLRPVNAARGKLAATVPPGPRKTAVILVRFNSDDPPWTPDQVRQRVFTDSDSANAFYKEDSYGDVSLVGKDNPDGDVYGWYTVAPPGPDANYGCDVDAIASEAQAAATAADGFNPDGYDHIIYAFPWQSACGWAGLGELPGNESWINGYVEYADVVAHELGHNMGIHHASSLKCTQDGVVVAMSSTCTSDEYGDPFDVMGNSSHHNNAWHLAQLGFLPPDDVQVANGDGTYTISATSARGGTQLLRIARPAGSSPPYYDLELRATNGVFDDFLSNDPAVQGVTIHADPALDDPTQSKLIDATPGSFWGFADAPLPAGGTFSDGALSISVKSIDNGVATVDVTTGSPPQDVTPPSAPDPVTATASETKVELSWPAATDDFGVAGYRVLRGSTQLGTTTGRTWTDTDVTPGSSYTYRVAAFDAAGNVSTSAPVTATVPQPPPPPPPPSTDPGPAATTTTTTDPGAPTTTTDPGASTTTDPTQRTNPGTSETSAPDLTRPRVTIESPSRHSRLRRRATIRAVATDNVRVVRIELWIDLKLRKSVRGTKLSWPWVLRHTRRGRHVIAVRAIDSSGNEGTASVRPYVVR